MSVDRKSTQQDADDRSRELLCEIEQPHFRLSLWLEDKRMVCRAEYQRLAEPVSSEADEEQFTSEEVPDRDENLLEDIHPAGLRQLLARHNISKGTDFEALYGFCAVVEEGCERLTAVLARGKTPQNGKDGWFELVVKTSGEDIEFTEDAHGKVDLRTLHAYTEIDAGQKIGVLHPPQEGVPGWTVVGDPLPAERGLIFSLVAGEGVELKYGGRIAFATKSGRALLDRQVLSVVDQWVVKGDVDLNVGNIDFHGFVEVKGDVLDDFYIAAPKGILVRGVVGACRLESEGTIEIGSMAGKERGRIICRGNLLAGFLNQANVQCHGDVLVKNEIRNSIVKSTGRIIVERGGIVGGHCVALEGIEARVLGAPSGLATVLTAGVYFPDADRFAFLKESLVKINAHIERIQSAIGPLEKLVDIDDTTSKRLAILTEQWEHLETAKDEFNAELAASTRQERRSCNPKINVAADLLAGVQLSLGRTTEKLTIDRKGPLSIIENSRKGGFRYLGMTPLQRAAEELEEEILAEELAAEEAIRVAPEAVQN